MSWWSERWKTDDIYIHAAPQTPEHRIKYRLHSLHKMDSISY